MTVILTVSTDDRQRHCDHRCYDAVSEHCDCVCEGVNHGVGFKQALLQAEAVAKRIVDDEPEAEVEVVREDEVSAVARQWMRELHRKESSSSESYMPEQSYI